MHLRSLLLLLSLTACRSLPLVPRRESEDAKPPASFVRSTADVRATRMIEVREGLARPQALRIVTDALSEKFVVEVTDPRAGFVMTAWQSSLTRDGVPDLRYRTRIIARFLGESWGTLQLRDEANWARGDEWDIGYDAAQLDTVSTLLRTRLGKPQP
jgi:hypothetical protein